MSENLSTIDPSNLLSIDWKTSGEFQKSALKTASEWSFPYVYWTDPTLPLSVSREAKIIDCAGLEFNASTEFASRTDVERVMNLYIVPDAAAVRTYLAKYPFLVALLIDASFAISKHFPEVKTELNVAHDPEIAMYECLHAMILAPGSYRETKVAAENFECGWWFGAMERARDKLSIDLF